MKTPEEWLHIWQQRGSNWTFNESCQRIEEVQRDALSDPMANISDQRELDMAKSIANNERIRADQLYGQMIKWRKKYHEARRYLREANRGAARNNAVIQLLTAKLQIEKTKQ